MHLDSDDEKEEGGNASFKRLLALTFVRPLLRADRRFQQTLSLRSQRIFCFPYILGIDGFD
jgi:hypothetical protein